MEKIGVEMTLGRITKGAVRYEEEKSITEGALIGTMYIRKIAFPSVPQEFPRKIKVTVEEYEA